MAFRKNVQHITRRVQITVTEISLHGIAFIEYRQALFHLRPRHKPHRIGIEHPFFYQITAEPAEHRQVQIYRFGLHGTVIKKMHLITPYLRRIEHGSEFPGIPASVVFLTGKIGKMPEHIFVNPDRPRRISPYIPYI